MEQKDVIAFFDHCAPFWDADMVRDEAVIAAILDNGGIRAVPYFRTTGRAASAV